MDSTVKNITVMADTNKLEEVLAFIDEELQLYQCAAKQQIQIDIAVEEIFVNIANYSYSSKPGEATVGIDFEPSAREVAIYFADSGMPYNPLEKVDPDINLGADERELGGLGIYMVKQSMDSVTYQYKDCKNILIIKKRI